jgi:hypothetical protein
MMAGESTKDMLQVLTDSIGRNLRFENQIRSQIFQELDREFYNGSMATGRKPGEHMGYNTFQSATMDSWLREGFHFSGDTLPIPDGQISQGGYCK